MTGDVEVKGEVELVCENKGGVRGGVIEFRWSSCNNIMLEWLLRNELG